MRNGAKSRTKAEVDEIIIWLTGYNADSLQRQMAMKLVIFGAT